MNIILLIYNPTKKLSLAYVFIKFFNITPQGSTCTMFIMFTDELFLGFETICSTVTGLWYGQEELGYPAP
jgi:hypothetical protein